MFKNVMTSLYSMKRLKALLVLQPLEMVTSAFNLTAPIFHRTGLTEAERESCSRFQLSDRP